MACFIVLLIYHGNGHHCDNFPNIFVGVHGSPGAGIRWNQCRNRLKNANLGINKDFRSKPGFLDGESKGGRVLEAVKKVRTSNRPMASHRTDRMSGRFTLE